YKVGTTAHCPETLSPPNGCRNASQTEPILRCLLAMPGHRSTLCLVIVTEHLSPVAGGMTLLISTMPLAGASLSPLGSAIVPLHRHMARSTTYDQHPRVVMLSETRSYIHEYTRSQHSKLCNTAQICWFVRDEHCIEHQRAKRKKPSQTINATAPVR